MDWWASLELTIILLFIYLIVRWTKSEGQNQEPDFGAQLANDEANKTAADYKNELLKKIDTDVAKRVTKTPAGLLSKESVLAINREIVYHNVKANIKLQQAHRLQRRVFYREKVWKEYKKVIMDVQQELETSQMDLTEAVMKALGIEVAVFAQSLQMIKYHENLEV